ncbi:MAG: magnesium transporter [Armatimonadota bacterium]
MLHFDATDGDLALFLEEATEQIRTLMTFPEGSAGRLITSEFLSVSPEATMNEVITAVRTAGDEAELVNYVYVLSPDRHLLGIVSLRKVLRSAPETRVSEVMNAEPRVAHTGDRAEDVARALAQYGFSAMPVLDARGRMVGIITADDAQTVLQDADTVDVLRLGAVTGDAEAYLSLSVLELIKRRLPWLLILFIAEFFTGNVLRYYIPGAGDNDDPRNALLIAAKLMPFVPLLIGAGGNSGAQVTTTITRALALGEIRARDWAQVMRREIVVSLVCGIALGVVSWGRAALHGFLGYGQPPYIALSVGFALPCIIVWAATVGSLLPITAKRIGLDPAVMSAPFITTFVDATGLIIFFEIAKRVVSAYGHSL